MRDAKRNRKQDEGEDALSVGRGSQSTNSTGSRSSNRSEFRSNGEDGEVEVREGEEGAHGARVPPAREICDWVQSRSQMTRGEDLDYSPGSSLQRGGAVTVNGWPPGSLQC